MSKDYSNAHDSKGKFAKGNPGGGRTAGATSNPLKYKSNAILQAEIQQIWLTKLRDNADEIFEAILRLCKEKDVKSLLSLLPLMIAKPKEVDQDKLKVYEGKSIPELQEHIQIIADQLGIEIETEIEEDIKGEEGKR